MAITKAETLDAVHMSTSGIKSLRAVYWATFTDDSTSPDTTAAVSREVNYVASDTIPSGENQLVKDLAAVLFA